MTKQKYDEPEPPTHKEPDQMRADASSQLAPHKAHGHTGKFQVSLEHAATLIVEAKDEAEAWEKYKEQWGIIASHPIGHAKIERLQS
jgi:hypothetical protein